MKSPDRTYDFDNDRILDWFSCGATSAVACHIMKDFPNAEFLYCDTGSEHSSNKKFLEDISNWIDRPIKILSSEFYADIWGVFEQTRWLVGPLGARCTVELKKAVRQKYEHYDDIQVFGFDADEEDRAEKFIVNNQEVKMYAPLIEQGISKGMALEIIKKAGIELPFMYQKQKSGAPYGHNNCIGCVKGQMGYWNKIRIDFPDVFERMAKMERNIGAAINKTYAGDGKRKVVYLDELDPKAGRFEDEAKMTCDMFCQVEVEKFLTGEENG